MDSMSESPFASTIKALLAAVASSPDDVPLRLNVADLLSKDGRPKEALEQYGAILTNDPSHLEALKGAASAAEACGLTERASGYKRLLSALAPSSATAPSKISDADSYEDEDDDEPEEKRPQLKVVQAADRFRIEDEPQTEKITLADVGGLEDVKKRLNRAFLAPLRNPEISKAFSKSLRGGLLLYGPPGCGKTFIARAVAGELGAKFFNIGIHDVLDMWLGESERKLHELFETARRAAPAVIFFDELDALGHKRSELKGGGIRTVVNSLLSELDGAGVDNKGVFTLAATNHPWDVDPALKRPNRFDRLVLVLPPDEPAREAILKYSLRHQENADVDLKKIAKKTEGFSGADLTHLTDSAIEFAMEDALDSGKVNPVNTDHFARALKEVRTSTRPWFETARNYAMFANEGGVYDDLLAYIRARGF